MAVNTQARGYTLPIDLIDTLSSMPKNRSTLVSEAIHAAHKDPSRLLSALKRRLSEPQAHARTTRVTVSVTEQTTSHLAELTHMTQLGTEHVLRLALEDYLHRS